MTSPGETDLPATPFWFLRHGETDYNARGLSQGALEIDLNETGRAQARKVAPVLAGRGIAAIVSSPMRRARETAAIVNEVLKLPISYEPELCEVVFGKMEGQPLTPWYADWLEGRMTPEGAESFAQLLHRVHGATARVLAHPGPLLIVSHGGVFRALRRLMGLTQEGATTPNAMPLFCEPSDAGWQITQG